MKEIAMHIRKSN